VSWYWNTPFLLSKETNTSSSSSLQGSPRCELVLKYTIPVKQGDKHFFKPAGSSALLLSTVLHAFTTYRIVSVLLCDAFLLRSLAALHDCWSLEYSMSGTETGDTCTQGLCCSHMTGVIEESVPMKASYPTSGMKIFDHCAWKCVPTWLPGFALKVSLRMCFDIWHEEQQLHQGTSFSHSKTKAIINDGIFCCARVTSCFSGCQFKI